MSHLPELLEALGGFFLVPGFLPAAAFRAVAGSDWLPDPIRTDLLELADQDDEDLGVEYAACFLVGREAPTVHLELSVLSTGHLQGAEVISLLKPFYSSAGLDLDNQPDHLGSLLGLLAALLRRLARDPDALQGAQSAILLVRDHLKPLTGATLEGLERHPAARRYRVGVSVTQGVLDFVVQLLN